MTKTKSVRNKRDKIKDRQQCKIMAEHSPDERATEWFRRPAGAVAMIRAQGQQIEKSRSDGNGDMAGK